MGQLVRKLSPSLYPKVPQTSNLRWVLNLLKNDFLISMSYFMREAEGVQDKETL